jgi:hypothetical protein
MRAGKRACNKNLTAGMSDLQERASVGKEAMLGDIFLFIYVHTHISARKGREGRSASHPFNVQGWRGLLRPGKTCSWKALLVFVVVKIAVFVLSQPNHGSWDSASG